MVERGKAKGKVKTTLKPAGFIEQRYEGQQSAGHIESGVKELNKYAKVQRAKKNPVLILIDISDVVIDFDREMFTAGIDGMRSLTFKRGAVYGTLPSQVLINTLALVAGKQHKVQAFGARSEAIKWLTRENK